AGLHTLLIVAQESSPRLIVGLLFLPGIVLCLDRILVRPGVGGCVLELLVLEVATVGRQLSGLGLGLLGELRNGLWCGSRGLGCQGFRLALIAGKCTVSTPARD